jgi:hypothetical protein
MFWCCGVARNTEEADEKTPKPTRRPPNLDGAQWLSEASNSPWVESGEDSPRPPPQRGNNDTTMTIEVTRAKRLRSGYTNVHFLRPFVRVLLSDGTDDGRLLCKTAVGKPHRKEDAHTWNFSAEVEVPKSDITSRNAVLRFEILDEQDWDQLCLREFFGQDLVDLVNKEGSTKKTVKLANGGGVPARSGKRPSIHLGVNVHPNPFLELPGGLHLGARRLAESTPKAFATTVEEGRTTFLSTLITPDISSPALSSPISLDSYLRTDSAPMTEDSPAAAATRDSRSRSHKSLSLDDESSRSTATSAMGVQSARGVKVKVGASAEGVEAAEAAEAVEAVGDVEDAEDVEDVEDAKDVEELDARSPLEEMLTAPLREKGRESSGVVISESGIRQRGEAKTINKRREKTETFKGHGKTGGVHRGVGEDGEDGEDGGETEEEARRIVSALGDGMARFHNLYSSSSDIGSNGRALSPELSKSHSRVSDNERRTTATSSMSPPPNTNAKMFCTPNLQLSERKLQLSIPRPQSQLLPRPQPLHPNTPEKSLQLSKSKISSPRTHSVEDLILRLKELQDQMKLLTINSEFKMKAFIESQSFSLFNPFSKGDPKLKEEWFVVDQAKNKLRSKLAELKDHIERKVRRQTLLARAPRIQKYPLSTKWMELNSIISVHSNGHLKEEETKTLPTKSIHDLHYEQETQQRWEKYMSEMEHQLDREFIDDDDDDDDDNEDEHDYHDEVDEKKKQEKRKVEISGSFPVFQHPIENYLVNNSRWMECATAVLIGVTPTFGIPIETLTSTKSKGWKQKNNAKAKVTKRTKEKKTEMDEKTGMKIEKKKEFIAAVKVEGDQQTTRPTQDVKEVSKKKKGQKKKSNKILMV